MDNSEMQPLYDDYHRKLSKVSLQFKRYLYSQINWQARVICIKGERGVGKTTMLLQNILESYADVDRTLYVSLDNLWFSAHSLIELVDWADRHGILRLYLDEVHRYPHWSEVLKNIYDNYPDMGIVYTSSSLLIMEGAKADLSRRQTSYTLYGMSFREFLQFEGKQNLDVVALSDLLHNHVRIAMDLTRDIKIAPLLEQYLSHGYYPFYKEVGDDFSLRLRDVVSVVIDTDLPAVEKVTFETTEKAKRLLMIISEHVPFEPTMSVLWRQLSTSNELGIRMLYALDRAHILDLLMSNPKSYKYLCKPDKIYLGNTNLMHALCRNVDVGNERETFFLTQLQVAYEVNYPTQGDFLVDKHWLFEVGGKTKTFDQIKDAPDSYLAVDDTEVGFGNRIPLWMFGLLY